MDFVDVALGGGLAMVATALGAAGVLAFRKIDQRAFPLILSFSAGVMAVSAAEMLYQSNAAGGPFTALAGLACGLLVFFLLEKLLPHAHMLLTKREMEHTHRKAVMLAGAITLHNIPEGFAIASAFAGSAPLGWIVSISMALQDFPEGLVVSAPLTYYGLGRWRSFLWGAFSGIVEFAAAIAGYAFLNTIRAATPFALGISAGAMTYLVLFELLVESFKGKISRGSALSFIAGAAIAFAITWLLAVR